MPGRAVALLLVASVGLVVLGGLASAGGARAAAPSSGLSVSLSATPSYGTAPLLVDFEATVSSGTPTAYNWTFGDGTYLNGTAASAGRPSHVYTDPGSFTASVVVAEGTVVANSTIDIHAIAGPLAVRVSASPVSGIAPLTVSFQSTVTGGTETYLVFNWTFGDGGTGSGSRVNWTYEHPGDFYAELTVEDSGLDQAHEGIWVNVSAAPAAKGGTSITDLGTLGWGIVGFAVGLAVAVLAVLGRSWIASRRTPVVPDGAATGPPSPTSPTPEGEVLPPPPSPSRPATALAQPARPDARPRGETLHLSQRIVLHLAGQGNPGPYDVALPGATQAGMSTALEVRQNALTNVLRRLIDGGVLAVEVRHVRGQPRRLKVYHLTPRGELLARELRHRPPRGPAE